MTDPSQRGSAFVERWQHVDSSEAAALASAEPIATRALDLVRRVLGPGVEIAWSDAQNALLSDAAGDPPRRLGLRVAELTLLALDRGAPAPRTIPLHETTPSDAIAEIWAGPHEPTDEAPFEKAAGLDALERALRNADAVLRAVARACVDATRVVCASKSLGVETRLALHSREGEDARTIRVGFTPASPDAGFYVVAEPVGTSWRLRLRDLVGHRDGGEQAATLSSFLETSIREAHETLHREWHRRG